MTLIKRVTSDTYLMAPWNDVSKFIQIEFQDPVFNNETFEQYVQRYFTNYEKLFTDGSKITDENTSSAASAMFSPSQSISVCWKLRPEHSVISTELYAIWRTLKYVGERDTVDVVIFTDSMSSLQLISSNPKSYSSIVQKIQNLLIDLNQEKNVVLHWVKAHCGILGNEIADRSANKGHSNSVSELYDLTIEEMVSILKRNFQEYWNDYWKFTSDLCGKGMFLRAIRDDIKGSEPVAKLSSRRHEVVIHRLRMGHAGLKQYLYRFEMEENDECEHCQLPESIEHYIMSCPLHQDPRTIMFRNLSHIGVDNPTLKLILGGEEKLSQKRNEIFKILIQFIKSTNKIKLL